MLLSNLKYPSTLIKKRSISILICFLIIFFFIFGKFITLSGISFYQKNISPIKGFKCGYAVLYKQQPSCSEYAKQSIRRYGLFEGTKFMMQRFKECQNASIILRSEFCMANPNLNENNQPDCGQCCCNGCFDELFDSLKKEIDGEIENLKRSLKEKLKKELEDLKDIIKSKWEELKTSFYKFLSDTKKYLTNVLIEKNEVDNTDENEGTNPLEDENLDEESDENIDEHADTDQLMVYKETLEKLIEEAIATSGNSLDFDGIIDLMFKYKAEGIFDAVKNETGIDYMAKFPSRFLIVYNALIYTGKPSGITNYGYDPAYHNEMFKDAIDKYIEFRDSPAKQRQEVYAVLEIFSDSNKKIIFERIELIDPQKKPVNGLEAQRLLGVRKQCKEWVDSISKESGGKVISYKEAKITLTKTNAKAGKAIYLIKPIHSAIIIKINGNETSDGIIDITSIEIAEANWDNNWEDPIGQIPWERTVGKRTIKASNFSNWHLADIDE